MCCLGQDVFPYTDVFAAFELKHCLTFYTKCKVCKEVHASMHACLHIVRGSQSCCVHCWMILACCMLFKCTGIINPHRLIQRLLLKSTDQHVLIPIAHGYAIATWST